MPIWLRRLTYNYIVEAKQAEADQIKKSTQSENTIDMANPDKSKIPDYVMKASRK